MKHDAEEYITFELALQLGMTVSELRQRMSGAEFVRWLAFLSEKGARERAALDRAARKHG